MKDVAIAARAPRFLYVHWPFGHALGEPGNARQQLTVLHDMLAMSIIAPAPGMVLELPYRWRRETYVDVEDWNTPSKALMAAMARAETHLKGELE